jgi:hypothetical protein
MQKLILGLLFIGIILITISLTKEFNKCSQKEIIYRYIPRTLDEEMENPNFVTDIFYNMFSEPSPWLGSIQNYDRKKAEQINKYFISQI